MKPMIIPLAAAALLAGLTALAPAASAQRAYYGPEAVGPDYVAGAYPRLGPEQSSYGRRDDQVGPQAYDRGYPQGAPRRDGSDQRYDQGYGGGYAQAGRDQTGYGQGYGRDDSQAYRQDIPRRTGSGQGYGGDYGAPQTGGYGDERAYAYNRDRRGYADRDGYQGGYGSSYGGGDSRYGGYGGDYRDRSYGHDRPAYRHGRYDEYSGFVAPPISGPEVYGYGPEDQQAYDQDCGCR